MLSLNLVEEIYTFVYLFDEFINPLYIATRACTTEHTGNIDIYII